MAFSRSLTSICCQFTLVILVSLDHVGMVNGFDFPDKPHPDDNTLGNAEKQLKMYNSVRCPACELSVDELTKKLGENAKKSWGETEVQQAVTTFCGKQVWDHEVKEESHGVFKVVKKPDLGIPKPSFELNDSSSAIAKICKEYVLENDVEIAEMAYSIIKKSFKGKPDQAQLTKDLRKKLGTSFCKKACKKKKGKKEL
eukprot:TRINITY_DN25325_c0_g1_i1.p1 TRINITY_DN25325_c0_g1~~TRINITY_DN25325_c0_g1_i1.p1  ORF type:complete len:198 (+),score=42.07 TRINITY_DN25325_c0_g1_i1:130-723(+)